MSPRRLAIVVSHPIQYYSPWFRDLAAQSDLRIKVFYLWDFGVTEKRDPTFGTSFKWDVPLMDGYESTFVPNVSKDPGTHHFTGLDNPGLNDALLDWNPDAILLIGYNYKSLLRLIFSPRLRRIPILFRGDSHELCPSTGWKPRLSRFLRSLIFRRFDRVLAVGSASVDYFRSSGVPMERIRIIPHCVDNDRFRNAATETEMEAGQWKQELGIPEGATVILFSGKLENKKRPQDLLEAFLTLLSRQSTVEAPEPSHQGTGQNAGASGLRRSTIDARLSTDPVLLFVGSGHLENDLRRMAGDRMGRDVFFAPFQNQSAMPKVYATGDILVLPSFGRSETWGLAVNEAMNLARPAIVSSHVGCGPDLIEAGVTGWVFRAGDVSDLQKCLQEALSDPARLKRMGLAAREKIKGLSYEVATKGVVKAVREVGGGEGEIMKYEG
jgi:glycosyltransferase involved in cell wall biosynthesis